MKKILIVFIVFFCVGCSSQTPELKEETPLSSIVSTTTYSPELGIDWNYSVYLPKNYEENASQFYPVLYLLHGAYGNHRNMIERFPIQEQLDSLNTEIIVVFVDGFNSFYIDGPTLAMESAIVNDLIPFIEETYRVDHIRENRYIGGISMGGYGSINIALSHPEIFSKALLLSPAVWENMTEVTVTNDWHIYRDEEGTLNNDSWLTHHPSNKIKDYPKDEYELEVIIISGDKDQVVNIKEVQEFSKNMEDIAKVNLQVISDGEHNWATWEEAMNSGLKELEQN